MAELFHELIVIIKKKEVETPVVVWSSDGWLALVSYEPGYGPPDVTTFIASESIIRYVE